MLDEILKWVVFYLGGIGFVELVKVDVWVCVVYEFSF